MEALTSLMVDEERTLTTEEKEEWDQLESRNKTIDSILEAVNKTAEDRNSQLDNDSKPVHVQVVREERHDENGEYRGFTSLGDQLGAVARAMTPGRDTDKRLVELRAATGAGEAVGADGGFAVQSDFAMQMFDRVVEQSDLASECTVVPLSANSNELVLTLVDESSRATGSRFGGVQGYWRAEGTNVTHSRPKLRQERLKAESLEALWYASDELLEDTTAMTALAELAFTQELSWLIDDAIIGGDGSGKPLGILNSGALITTTRATSSTIEYTDIDLANDRMWVGGRSNAKWYCHADVPQKLRNAYASPGSNSDWPVLLPAGGISGAPHDTIFAKEVKVIEQARALGALGDFMLLDLSQYLLVRKAGVKAAQSAHVRFIYGEQTFKWTVRINGQPLWNTTLTDAYGSTTRSPFVATAA